VRGNLWVIEKRVQYKQPLFCPPASELSLTEQGGGENYDRRTPRFIWGGQKSLKKMGTYPVKVNVITTEEIH